MHTRRTCLRAASLITLTLTAGSGEPIELDGSEELGVAEDAVETGNAPTPNALTPNALRPNALTSNALTSNAKRDCAAGHLNAGGTTSECGIIEGSARMTTSARRPTGLTSTGRSAKSTAAPSRRWSPSTSVDAAPGHLSV